MAFPDRLSHRPELEPFPKYPILMLGAGQGTGAKIAELFAKEGYPVIVGTRSADKFNVVSGKIKDAGGVEPQPFLADITKWDQVKDAYRSLQLEPGTPLHFFPFAAGGFEKVLPQIGRTLVPLLRAKRGAEPITCEMFESATADIKSRILQSPDITNYAYAVNTEGILTIAELLASQGHLTENSTTLYLSSNISDYTDPNNPEEYPGPWLYYPIGMTKKSAVLGLEKVVTEIGGTFIDVVAPEIKGTDVGNMLDTLQELLRLAGEDVVVPAVSMEDVAQVAFQEATKKGEKLRKIYITKNGTTHTKPEEFKVPISPYL